MSRVRFDPPLRVRVQRTAIGFGPGYLDPKWQADEYRCVTKLYVASFAAYGAMDWAVVEGMGGLRCIPWPSFELVDG